MNDRDYIIDIPGLEHTTGHLAPAPGSAPAPESAPGSDPGSAPGSSPHHSARPWLSIYFKCCHTYTRIYRNRRGDAYEGRCPRCATAVRAAIGPDGTPNRFFTAE